MTLSTPTTDLRAVPPRRRRRNGTAVLAVLGVLVVGALTAVWGWWNGSIGSLPVRAHCTATASGSTAELDPEQAGNAATIAAVALQRGLPARAATIGIATALQESKLINLPDGDRDSAGLFQQRPSQGWGTAEQVQDPVYATNAFYDVLVKIEGYQNLPITTAAQKVQRSAFPSAYASHEPEARIWASNLSGYSPAGLSCVLPKADLPQQQPGSDGLTDRTRALNQAARTELGRAGTAVAGAEGRTLRFAATRTEPTRFAWALAQWSVAKADALGVTEVQVEGRRWRRDQGDEGWTALEGGPAAGVVVIRIA